MTKIKKFKFCRKYGSGLYEKCGGTRFSLSEQKRRMNRKLKRPRPLSDYGKKLLEKQKLRFSYGLKEKALSGYVNKSLASDINTLEKLSQSIEARLDNVIYRLGFAKTRAMARQMVTHKHIKVNGRVLNVPSYQVKIGDIVNFKEGSEKSKIYENVKNLNSPEIPKWLSFDKKNISGSVIEKPNYELISPYFDFKKIIEFYTR